MYRLTIAFVVACSSSPSTSTTPPPSTAPADAAVVAIDAAPDAPSATDGELAAAPAHVFRYNAPPRVETWTLRIAGDRASIVVAGEREVVYVGRAAASGDTTNIDVATSTAKLGLACKRAKLANVGAANAERKPGKPGKPCAFVPATTTTLDVWECKHLDFEAPMPFAAAPGVEYVVTDACKDGAYRRVAD
jgi:hypothetical protein